MIIFGTKGYLHQLAVLTLVCGRCGNPAAHTLRKRVTRFTLFFVPLFPFSTKYATQCTFCGAEQQTTAAQAEQLRQQAGGGQSAPGHRAGYGADPATGPRYGQAHGQHNPYQN
ncbi:zinc ribbon domain-containing protein [Streptomyces sp. C10-9-1]|uniref:zinc-ribbon domain-containing protein n=1 Tax=Streptomyces sp. C10-9-1 TaxID=1859285 RepID=UPI00211245B4|nr:zinc ribbon domain-containing protein [Streptomyces sp. C10-9-1]MCQ6552821.1 zinc ribbon domain-containing protein [Streptomyces sp. C10-9-1]